MIKDDERLGYSDDPELDRKIRLEMNKLKHATLIPKAANEIQNRVFQTDQQPPREVRIVERKGDKVLVAEDLQIRQALRQANGDIVEAASVLRSLGLADFDAGQVQEHN